MKKTVKFLSVTVFAIAFLSCDKDSEDTTPEGVTSGEWQLVALRKNREDLDVATCFKKSTLTVGADGTFSRTTYTNEENCVIDSTETGNGTYVFDGTIIGQLTPLKGEGPKEVELRVNVSSRNDLEYLERKTETGEFGETSGFILYHIYERVE